LHGSFANPIAIMMKRSGIIEVTRRGRNSSEAAQSGSEKANTALSTSG
jgi:hypothetical protein